MCDDSHDFQKARAKFNPSQSGRKTSQEMPEETLGGICESYPCWTCKERPGGSHANTFFETNSSHLKMDGWKMRFLLG